MNSDALAALAPEAQKEWIERRGDQLLEQVRELTAENGRLKVVVGTRDDLETEVEKRRRVERERDDLRRQLDEAPWIDKEREGKLKADDRADELQEQVRRTEELTQQVRDLRAENAGLKALVGEGGDLHTEREKRQKAERSADDLRRQLDEAQRRMALEQATTPGADQVQNAKLEADQKIDQLNDKLVASQAEVGRLREVLGEGADVQNEREQRLAAERERDAALSRLDEAERRLALNSGVASREEELANELALTQSRSNSLETRRTEAEKEVDRLRAVVGEQGDIQSEVDRRISVERERDVALGQLDEARRRLAINADAEGRQDALLKARSDAETRALDLSSRLREAEKEVTRLHAVVGEQGEIAAEVERREWAEARFETAQRRVDELERQLQKKERMLEAAQEPAA
jgi:DNA repair exonuclease SbcCD ATPase subunit